MKKICMLFYLILLSSCISSNLNKEKYRLIILSDVKIGIMALTGVGGYVWEYIEVEIIEPVERRGQITYLIIDGGIAWQKSEWASEQYKIIKIDEIINVVGFEDQNGNIYIRDDISILRLKKSSNEVQE